MATVKEIKKISRQIEKEIQRRIDQLEREIKSLEADLMADLMTAVLDKVSLDKEGQLKNNQKNVFAANAIDTAFAVFFASRMIPHLKRYGKRLTGMFDLSKRYFQRTGHSRSKIRTISKKQSLIMSRIGLTKKGQIKKDGFLFNLGSSSQIREQLKDFVFRAIADQVSLAAFTAGFRQLARTSKESDGLLLRTWKEQAFDTFNQIHEHSNRIFAQDLDLQFFIYEGSLIKTSRQFCIDRAGKVFHVDETKTWKNDPNLIEPRTRLSYQPLIERGRYNCRHMIRYISKELAFRLRPELKNFDQQRKAA